MKPYNEKEKLWVAYVDGQLSPSEALEFEATLTDAERDRCAQEMRLEGILGDLLSEEVTCPAAVWQQTIEQVSLASKQRTSWLGHPAVAIPTFIGLAAAMVLTFQSYMQEPPRRLDPILVMPATLADAEKSSGTPIGDEQAVRQFFYNRHIQLAMDAFNGRIDVDHHPVRLLGASERGCHGKSVVEIYFDCCHKPAKVLFAEKGTDAEDVLRDANRSGEIHHFSEIGDYVAAVVSAHPAPDLTQIFAPAKPVLAGLV